MVSNASREEGQSSPQRLRVAAEPRIAKLRCFPGCHEVQVSPYFLHLVSGNGQPDIHLPRHTPLQYVVRAPPSEGAPILPHLPSLPYPEVPVGFPASEGECHVDGLAPEYTVSGARRGIGTSAAQYRARLLRPDGAGGSSEGLPPAGRCRLPMAIQNSLAGVGQKSN